MSGKRYVPEVSMLGGEVDYAALSRMSVPSGESVLPADTDFALLHREMSGSSDVSEEVDFAALSKELALSKMSESPTSVWDCMGCGEKPAQSRKESVVVLCEDCAAYIFRVVMDEMSGITFITPHVRYRAVYAKMTETYGYAMVDAELAKMFD